MIYFDTDFWVNYYIEQNLEKQKLTQKILLEVNFKNQIFTSLLNVQEITFVFAKLNFSIGETERVVNEFWKHNPQSYSIKHFIRALELAKIIGFKNINDCIHTAIAEEFCDELYTFNRRDFEKIRNHTRLKINIL